MIIPNVKASDFHSFFSNENISKISLVFLINFVVRNCNFPAQIRF